MIEAIAEWVKSLIFLVLFAAFMELLLPSQSMQKFLRVVIGLLIMLAVLKPVAALMEYTLQPGDLPAFGAMESGVGQAAAPQNLDRDRLAHAVYRRELARQIQATVGTLPEIAAAKVDVMLSEKAGADREGEIERVFISVKAEDAQDKKRIEVRLHDRAEDMELKPPLRHKILRRVSELYQIPKGKIEINGWR